MTLSEAGLWFYADEMTKILLVGVAAVLGFTTMRVLFPTRPDTLWFPAGVLAIWLTSELLYWRKTHR